MNSTEQLDHLMQDGNLRVPAGRYGSDTASCAPVAMALARIVADETGEPTTTESLDHAMGLVVNSHDDVLTLIREHGRASERELISDAILDDWSDQARERGREAARTAADWIADGNTDCEAARRLLVMLENGDPEAESYLPAQPNLSGQWADDLTPARLYEDITGRDAHGDATWNQDSYALVADALADAYEDGAAEVFEAACEARLRLFVAACAD